MSTYFTEKFESLDNVRKVEELLTQLNILFVNAEIKSAENADFMIANSSIQYLAELRHLVQN